MLSFKSFSILYIPAILYIVVVILMAILKANAEAEVAALAAGATPDKALKAQIGTAVFFERITMPAGLLLLAVTIAAASMAKE